MQTVKFIMREVGSGQGMWTSEMLEKYLDENLHSYGYKLFASNVSEIVKDHSVIGMRVFLTYVLETEDKKKAK